MPVPFHSRYAGQPLRNALAAMRADLSMLVGDDVRDLSWWLGERLLRREVLLQELQVRLQPVAAGDVETRDHPGEAGK